MKVAVVLLAIVACVYAEGYEAEFGYNGLAALLADKGGMVEMPETRIVGGIDASIAQFPWIVTMQRFNSHRCGASIISHNRALTAAHCTIGIPASGLQLRAGSTASQSGGQLVNLQLIVNHPQYNPRTLDNDITVMNIVGSWNLGTNIRIVPLPQQGAAVATGVTVHVAGWGALCERCGGSASLRSVSKPVVSAGQCSAWYGGGITAGMLCAGHAGGGQDACQGDSGGPLTHNGLLVGVVSWGEGCARPQLPGVYARVAFYRGWINSLL